MYSNYIYIAICVFMNTAIYIYSSDNPVDRQASLHVHLYLFFIIVVAPAAMTFMSASSKKKRSGVIVYCSLLTIASGVIFTNIYSSSHDQSRGFILATHYALTYLFSFIALASYGRPSKKPTADKTYVANAEANRQISIILSMHRKEMSNAAIASILNQNSEPYISDNSEWSEEKVLGVISTFKSGAQKPN